jgi:hypothetical protein
MDTFKQVDGIVPTLGNLVLGIRPDQVDNPTACGDGSNDPSPALADWVLGPMRPSGDGLMLSAH